VHLAHAANNDEGTGISAKDLQRIMGFGSYETAWTWLYKLRASMVRKDREPLRLSCRSTRPSSEEKAVPTGVGAGSDGGGRARAPRPRGQQQ
jgi:hypothetical protein